MSERRAWQLAYERLKALDAGWDDAQQRAKGVEEVRRFLLAQRETPRLQALGNLLSVQMAHRALWSVLVPVEREAARQRVSDADILVHDAAAPAAGYEASMPAVAVLDSLRSALNLGGILRCCECFGFEMAVLCGYTADPAHPQVRRSAMGCEALMATVREEHVCVAIDGLKREGRRIVALETTEGACELGRYRFQFPCAIVLGNERFGISPAALELCDDVVRIAMHGSKNSLNVVSAFAIAAHAARICFSDLR